MCCSSSVANLCVGWAYVCCLRNVVTCEGLVFLFEKREEDREEKNANPIRQTRHPHLSLHPITLSALLRLSPNFSHWGHCLSVCLSRFLSDPASVSRSIFIPSPTELTSGSYWQSERPFSHKRPAGFCACACVCLAKYGRPKCKHPRNKTRFHQTTRAFTNRQPQECRDLLRRNLLRSIVCF